MVMMMKTKKALIFTDVHAKDIKDLNEADVYAMKLISEHMIKSSHKHRLKTFLTKLKIESANPFGFQLKVKSK